MATKERLIVKTSYMDVLERMLRKRGGKMVMSGVREMTLAEEIRNLAELGVDQNVIDRMTQKYNRMLTDHGNTCNKIRDEVYREVRGVKAELAEKETIIRVLTTHIREKELTDVRTKYRILINNLMADFSKDIAQGKVKVKNINDFERLVKLDMLLMGEATERVERGGTQELSQDAKDRLDEIAQLMKSAKK